VRLRGGEFSDVEDDVFFVFADQRINGVEREIFLSCGGDIGFDFGRSGIFEVPGIEDFELFFIEGFESVGDSVVGGAYGFSEFSEGDLFIESHVEFPLIYNELMGKVI
jgi:hypothetical protein